jgi:hypothetical protein
MSIYTKLLEVQKEIGAIKKEETNPFFKSKYFDINGLLAAVKPVLNKHGLLILQGLTNVEGKLSLSTQLVDVETKEIVETVCPLPEATDAQKAGSTITYFRRYALQSLLALEAEDDDANVASGKPITKSDNFKI